MVSGGEEYEIICPPPCTYEIKVEANKGDEAVEKLMKAGAAHVIPSCLIVATARWSLATWSCWTIWAWCG
jgi:hypothetical protein